MTSGDIVLGAVVTFVGGGLALLLWERLNRLEALIVTLPTRAEFEALRAEVAELRREVAAMRSDLTQVALAVGARPPRASEGGA